MPPAPPLCASTPRRAGRTRGDMGEPHICEKNVGRQPDEAAFWKGTGERRGSAPRTRGRRQVPPAPPLCASTPRRVGRARRGHGGSAYLRKKRRAKARRSGFRGRNGGTSGLRAPNPRQEAVPPAPPLCASTPRRAGRTRGDMGEPHICEKNVGRQPDEAAFWKGTGERRGSAPRTRGRRQVPPAPPLCASTPRRVGRARRGHGGSAYLRKKRRAKARRSGFLEGEREGEPLSTERGSHSPFSPSLLCALQKNATPL